MIRLELEIRKINKPYLELRSALKEHGRKLGEVAKVLSERPECVRLVGDAHPLAEDCEQTADVRAGTSKELFDFIALDEKISKLRGMYRDTQQLQEKLDHLRRYS